MSKLEKAIILACSTECPSLKESKKVTSVMIKKMNGKNLSVIIKSMIGSMFLTPPTDPSMPNISLT